MSDKQETIADIIAEMREIHVAEFQDYADRLEAAHGRELAAGRNAAAAREALLKLRDATRNFYNQILNSGYSKILDKYTCVKQGFPAVLDVRDAIPLANVALSAPPRNCDRPECATYGEAIRTLEAECEDCDDPMEWLLAPAEEGGAK